MKSLALAALLVLSFSVAAQEPKPVPLSKEAHHHLVLHNDFTHVYYVEVPARDATLLHQHDEDYLFVAIGPADITSAVVGKPENHIQLADGQVRFTRGGFAHVARNNADAIFRNVSIDLLHHQGAVHNLCQKITDGPVNDCPDPPASETHSMKPLFETEEITVFSGSLAANAKHTEEAPKTAMLIVAMNNSEITVKVAKGAESQLKGGQVAWLPAGQSHTVSAGNAAARVLLVSFKDSAAH